MSQLKYLKPEFPPDAFAGTAVYYARYRIPYPQALIDDLIKRTAPTPQGKLLDLASGPGRIAIPLAPLFSKVWANDIEPEMIAVGKSDAKKHKVNNIEWLTGKAEELKAEPGSFDLITIGEAFHRLDQNLILDLTLQWLKPGGHIAITGCFGILSGSEPWQQIVIQIVNKWTSRHALSSEITPEECAAAAEEHACLVLQDKGFCECNTYSFVQPRNWTIRSIIGYLYSTSRCSKKVLGDKIVEFESGLKAALKKFDNRGRFFENVRCGYTLGEKPF